VLRVWEERATFLDALDVLPQTLVHGDVHELNLFTRAGPAGEEVVVIDWAWLGFGAVGEELAPAAMRFAERLPAEDQSAFAQVLVAAYLAGLHEAGWRGDARLVRLGYALATALRYLLQPNMFLFLDEAEHPRLERAFGMPVEDILHNRVANIQRRALALATEARDLLRLL
jgi:Ser/Thr protein kinase RdoA (MazF antagonist)